MRGKGILGVAAVLLLAAAGCGDGGGGTAFSFSCAPGIVAEGTTVRSTVVGSGFRPGVTEVDADLGTISNLVVESAERVAFDYTAPTFPPRTPGPKLDTLRVTNGTAPEQSCGMTIHLTPFLASCATTYGADHGAAPTTGVDAGALVVATVLGGNFVAGGAVVVQPRDGLPVPLDEVGAGVPFSAPGQFRVVDAGTIELTVPNVFSAGVPTILDGSPNPGPATLTYLSPLGLLATEAGLFRYVPVFLDFEEFRFQVPGYRPGLSAPGKVAVGDVNADGVPDIVMLAQQAVTAGSGAPEAFLFLANTFGPGLDVDGDGRAPDFAGSFAAQAINHPDVQTWVPEEALGQSILLASLDGDPELEILVPVLDDQGADPVLVVDIEPGGAVGELRILWPSSLPEYTAGIAVGNFDAATPHPDIAVLYGDGSARDRKLVIFRSRGAFDYVDTSHDIPSAYEVFDPGALGAGDFDGDGDDDLIWGQNDGPSGTDPEELPILVVRVDAAAGTVGAPQPISNLTGSPVVDIDVFDANGDGREDALVFIGGEARGALPGAHVGAGVATFLDPLALEGDAYSLTPYRYVWWDRAGNGTGLTHADFDGDGVTDLAVVNEYGEILVHLGLGDGTFASSERTWQVVTGETDADWPVQSLEAADFDGDGLAEILVGDMSNPPYNIVFWLNASR